MRRVRLFSPRTQVPFAYFLQYELFGQRFTAVQGLGMALILTSCVVNVRDKQMSASKRSSKGPGA